MDGRVHVPAGLAAATLLIAACGSASTAPGVVLEKAYGAAPSWEACRLVTVGEANELAGLGSRHLINTWVPASTDSRGATLYGCAWSHWTSGPGLGRQQGGASIELGCGTWVADTAPMAGSSIVANGIRIYGGSETFLGTPPSIVISITAPGAPPGAIAGALANAARVVGSEGCH
jgi:hypothetical protein